MNALLTRDIASVDSKSYIQDLEVNHIDLQQPELFNISVCKKNSRAGVWQLSALAAVMLASRQANMASTIPNATYHNYIKILSDANQFNFRLPSERIVFPKIDSGPIDMAEEPKTKSADKAELEKIFNGLAKKWKEETRGYSLTSQKYAHSAYQSILVLGTEVVPFILLDLQANGGRWFEALKALTKRSDITKPSDSYEDAVKAWIAWGKDGKMI